MDKTVYLYFILTLSQSQTTKMDLLIIYTNKIEPV